MTSSESRVFIIGAGLSGLSAAAAVAERGVRPIVFDAAGHAGGRCRSFYDKTLDRVIDNGNHLVMSANRHAMAFLDRIGSRDALTGPPSALYPFVDVKSGARWTIELTDGPVPLWVLDPRKRVPGSRLADYLGAARILFAKENETVADIVDRTNILYATFWEPLTLAVLNTTPELGQARLLWSVIRETFLLGGRFSRPLAARRGLGPAFIDPAAAFITSRGGELRLNARLRALEFAQDGRVARLDFPEGPIEVGPHDEVILAVTPSRVRQLLPEADPPEDDASILNVHYRFGREVPLEKLMGAPFIGMVSSDAQWVFVRDDVISITVSASHAIGMDDVPNAEAVAKIWRETQVGLGLGDAPYEAVRVIRERRATPDQSPAAVKKRLKAETAHANLTLAGDHTDTGVPATIEGSIRSGDRAAEIVLRRISA